MCPHCLPAPWTKQEEWRCLNGSGGKNKHSQWRRKVVEGPKLCWNELKMKLPSPPYLLTQTPASYAEPSFSTVLAQWVVPSQSAYCFKSIPTYFREGYLNHLVPSSTRPWLQDAPCSISYHMGSPALCQPCFNWASYLAFLHLAKNSHVSWLFHPLSHLPAIPIIQIVMCLSHDFFKRPCSNVSSSVRSSLCNLYNRASCLSTFRTGTWYLIFLKTFYFILEDSLWTVLW